MAVLIVTYDLKTPGKNYAPFYEELKRQGEWWHYLTSTWLISTEKSPNQVHQALGPHLSTLDMILVAPVTSPFWGWLPKDAWAWMRKHGLTT